MDNFLPSSSEGMPLLQYAMIAVAGVAAFGLTFLVARRAFGGRTQPDQTGGADDVADPFLLGSRSDRRAAHRRQGNQLTASIAHHKDQPHLEARIVNRSLGGVGLASTREFPVGTVFKVRPNTGAPTAPWVEMEVKSALMQNGEWQLGCCFVKTPPYSVLLMFG